MEETLEERITKFVELDERGNVNKVDWQGLVNLKNKCGYEYKRLFDDAMEDVLEFCRRKRFLIYRFRKGSFAVVDGESGMNVGPSCDVMVSYNFMRREDAEEYTKYAREFSGERGPVSVTQIV